MSTNLNLPLTPAQELELKEKKKSKSWKEIAQEVGKSPVWVASVVMGMNSAPEKEARAIATALDLPESFVAHFQQCPTKSFPQEPPSDPVQYRFWEMIQVYGPAMKAIIHEEFGDGIMSAIDFSMTIKRVEDPKGDRVEIVLNGKFLPYRMF